MYRNQESCHTSGSKPAITVFDTSEIQPGARLAECNEAICALLSPTESADLDSAIDYSAYLRNVAFGLVGVTQYHTTPIRDVRSRQMIQAKPDENLYLLRVLEGHGVLQQARNEISVSSGDAVLYDSSKEFIWEIDQVSSMQIARLPRANIFRKIAHFETLVARKIPQASPFSTMLGNVMAGALSFTDTETNFDTIRYGASIIDLMGTCLELGIDETPSEVRADNLLRRAKKALVDNVENSAFDLNALAGAINTSPRTISRVFAIEGTTPIRWLWERRLEQAYEIATSGSSLSVSQIALRCGFSDFAHFSRSFKKRFGVPPSTCIGHLRVS